MTFDRIAFGAAVKQRVEADHHTTTSAALAADVSRAQLLRAVHGQAVDAGATLSLCLWIGADPVSFLRVSAASRETSTEPRSAPDSVRSA